MLQARREWKQQLPTLSPDYDRRSVERCEGVLELRGGPVQHQRWCQNGRTDFYSERVASYTHKAARAVPSFRQHRSAHFKHPTAPLSQSPHASPPPHAPHSPARSPDRSPPTRAIQKPRFARSRDSQIPYFLMPEFPTPPVRSRGLRHCRCTLESARSAVVDSNARRVAYSRFVGASL